MKKILSLVLAMLMIFSIVPAAFAAETSEDSSYAEALDFLAAVGFYKGGAGVADDDAITRWQMALFVSRLVTGEVEDSYWATTENDSGFTDVDALEPYMLGAVTFAAQEGIINGYGDDTFGPNDGITYRDALVMTVRALGTKYGPSGYPWSYIATARELGLMNGITGIGWTDEITREVVAQILYNAFFAVVKGTTVAEKVFNIGCETVMVTASNRVVYETNGVEVLASGYVQIAAVDEQLEPTDLKYHVAGTTLGLKDANAQNGAVGGLYKVWYRNNFNTIVMYEDLNTLYTNRPDKKEVGTSGAWGDRNVTFNGKASKTVVSYTNLFNQDRPNSTADGRAETKLFGIGVNTANNAQMFGTKYVMYPDGWIYTIATLAPVGYYSQYLNAWYTYDASAKTYAAMVPSDEIYQDLHNGVQKAGGHLGFGSLVAADNTFGHGFSPYAEVLASDADQDGIEDRAIVKNFRIGYYTETSYAANKCTLSGCPKRDSSGNSAAHVHFAIHTSYTDADPANGTNDDEFNRFGEKMTVDTNAIKGDYNIVGGNPTNGTYFIYYIDTDNKELDIIKTIPQKSADTTDTYWSYGYVLGFFQTQNKIYINDGETRIPLDLGYADMIAFGSPLYPFGTGADATKKATLNEQLVNLLLPYVEQETYVKYLVLDGKVIMITEATPDSGDYVIIDSYADISADGIKVNAWSTVSNQYDVITIAEYNGWDINGVEWDALWQTAIYQAFATGKMPSMSDLLKKYVPIEFGKVYAVVSADADKNYNITTKILEDPDTNGNTDGIGRQLNKDVVVAGGYVHAYDTARANYAKIGNLSNTTVLETAANDFWLVKELKQDAAGNVIPGEYKVYARTGKLANVIFGDLAVGGLDVTVYKADAKSRDFVIEGTTAALANFLAQVDIVDNNKIRYAVYEGTNMSQSMEDLEYNAGSYFRQTFRDVITGDYFLVDFDTTKEEGLLEQIKLNRGSAATINTIYKIVDGELLSADGVDMKEVAAYVWAQKSYTKKVEVVGAAGETVNSLLTKALVELEKAVLNNTITDAQAADRIYIAPANLTYIVLDTADSAQYGIRYSGTANDINGNVKNDPVENAKAYVFYNDAATVGATKAVVYIDYGVAEDTITVKSTTATTDGTAEDTAKTATFTYTWNDNIDPTKVVITIDACDLAGWDTAAIDNTSLEVWDSTAKTLTVDYESANAVPNTYTIVVSNSTNNATATFKVTLG